MTSASDLRQAAKDMGPHYMAVNRVRTMLRECYIDPLSDDASRIAAHAVELVDAVLEAFASDLVEEPTPSPRPQHALVLIGSTANSESPESTLFVRDLQSEAVFKIQGVRV